MYACIKQHGSAVYVGMVVAVCIPQYNGKPLLAFYRVKTGRIELSRQKCAPHRRKWYPFFHLKMRQRVENVHDIFRILSFPSSNSSSPHHLAHERWGVPKWFNHRTARSSTHCIPLYLRGQRDAVCIWRFSSFFVRRLSVRRHLQWRRSYKWPPIRTTDARELVFTQAAQQDCRAPW